MEGMTQAKMFVATILTRRWRLVSDSMHLLSGDMRVAELLRGGEKHCKDLGVGKVKLIVLAPLFEGDGESG